MAARGGELLLVGAGGLAREAAAAVGAVNRVAPTWELLGFLDDDPATHASRIAGLPVLGGVDAVHDHPATKLLLCTARANNYVSRQRLAARLALGEERYATVVHPSAALGAGCRIAAGSVILAHVDLTADVILGHHVVVMPQVVLTHDVEIGDFATIASGVRLGGGCKIGAGAYIGAGVCVREGVRIGARALVGMGSVVTRDVPAERLWYGVPARDIRRAPIPQTVAASR